MSHSPHIWTVIMAGGVGSRFWPLSRRTRPKQLLDLFGGGSMVRRTVDRLLPLVPAERQVIVTGAVLGDAIREALPELPPANILEEPCGRNTAPAIGWAAAYIRRLDPDALLAILPADQLIVDEDAYRTTASQALEAAAQGRIVTLGIPATRPETGYGYIRSGAPLADGVLSVEAFKEKPDHDTALQYLADGGYYWNAGMFFAPADLMLDEMARYAPEVASGLDRLNSESPETVYPQLPSISIDYAVMERTERIAVIPGMFGWSDVGSWRTLWDFRGEDSSTYRMGDVVEIDGDGNVLFAEGGMVAAVGVSDLVVVHTPDVTLVCPRESAQRVREIVAALKTSGREELL
ncbi:MAG: mannose-1-phosphate guanylyltransferase [Myxococcota bacterium]|jgi:mannose-1-phosphate guanylyltransferase|nr:mannose-1-phosphate guanylyltransferase [Myxococcota bacterium]